MNKTDIMTQQPNVVTYRGDKYDPAGDADGSVCKG